MRDNSQRSFVLESVVVILLIVPALRVASTYHIFSQIFSQTFDEPIHIASGFQWLSSGQYDLDPEHPPLSRIAFALSPYLSGAAVSPERDRVSQGNELLYRKDRYRQNLAASRVGNLPFLLLSIGIVGLWSKRLFDNATAVVAVAIFGSLPPVLAHAGLATTDMAATATTLAAAFVFYLWLEDPAWRTALLLGISIGAGLISKFSFLVFFPVTAAMIVWFQNRGVSDGRGLAASVAFSTCVNESLSIATSIGVRTSCD